MTKANTIETKSFTVEVKASGDGIIEAYAAAFGNTDSYGDIIQKGAFIKTVSERKDKIKVLYNHDYYTQLPVGKPLTLSEDNYGLLTSTKMSKTQMGQDIYTLAQEGALDSMSIGYSAVKAEYSDEATYRTSGAWRTITEAKLFEYSFVPFPANESAIITGIKSGEDLAREIRRWTAITEVNLSTKAGRTLSGDNAKKVVAALNELQDLLAEAGVVAGDYQDGDRVVITGDPHMEGQSAGTVKLIDPGPAYGIVFDGMEDMGVHRWYVGDELEPEDAGASEDGKAKKPRKKPMQGMHGMKSLPRAGAASGTPGAANSGSEPAPPLSLLSALHQKASQLDAEVKTGSLLADLRAFGASLGGN